MRYVTFYYDLIRDRVSELTVHSNKELALKYFNKNCDNHFKFNAGFKANALPASYGYPFRKYYGVSIRKFKEMFDMSIDEVLEQMRGKKE